MPRRPRRHRRRCRPSPRISAAPLLVARDDRDARRRPLRGRRSRRRRSAWAGSARRRRRRAPRRRAAHRASARGPRRPTPARDARATLPCRRGPPPRARRSRPRRRARAARCRAPCAGTPSRRRATPRVACAEFGAQRAHPRPPGARDGSARDRRRCGAGPAALPELRSGASARAAPCASCTGSLRRIGEDLSFDREQHAMARREAPPREAETTSPRRSVLAVHVLRVAAAARSEQVLMPGAREGVHDVEGASWSGARRSAREGQDAPRLPRRWHAHGVDLHGFGCSGRARDDMDLVAGGGESVCDLPGHALDAAAGLEALDHEGDAQAAPESELRPAASREEDDGQGDRAEAGGLRNRRGRNSGAAGRRAVAADPTRDVRIRGGFGRGCLRACAREQQGRQQDGEDDDAHAAQGTRRCRGRQNAAQGLTLRGAW